MYHIQFLLIITNLVLPSFPQFLKSSSPYNFNSPKLTSFHSNAPSIMDSTLFEAARTGNTDELFSLLRTNPLILQTATLEAGDTPLHIAAASGHIDFTREILKINPTYATETNPDGLTALHIASAVGEVGVVKEIVKLGGQLCLLKGRERRIALHYAAIKGRVEVMKELLEACPSSVEEVTARKETAIYLAVKNNQFKGFVELVKWLRHGDDRQSVINWKNSQGNTVLHLAVAMKQFEVVEFLLSGNALDKDTVQVNALNGRGLTALDVLSSFDSEAGDREIADILIRAGALTAQTFVPRTVRDSTICDPPRAGERTSPKWCRHIVKFIRHHHGWLDYFRYRKDRDSPDFIRSALLLVAALIATATYTAVLQPPGGLWQDDWPPIGSNVTAIGKTHKAGQAVLGSLNPISYALFLTFNSMGFFASVQMINCLTYEFPLRMEVRIALSALIATYDTAMAALTPNSFFNFFFVGLSIVMPVVMHLLSVWVRK